MVTANRAIVAARTARQATLAANADSARRNKLNLENLATFFAAMGKAAAVDEWLAYKIAPLLEQGAKRRDEQRRKAGAALLEIHARGEQIHDIARLAGIAENQVRELMRMADARPASESEVQVAAIEQARAIVAAASVGPA